MMTRRSLALVLSFLFVAGCGYNPSKTSAAKPDSGAPSSQGEVGGTQPDLGVKQDTTTDSGGSDSSINPGGADGGSAGAVAGTTGTGATTGAAGATGTGGGPASGGSETGGATSLGGTTSVATTSGAGGSTLTPDAGLPADAPVVVSCPSPTAPSHGLVLAPSLSAGSEATYKCETGYGSPAVTIRTCQNDGTWSGAEPVCSLVDCGTPPALANGKVEAAATTYNSTAKYTCDAGYTASASTTKTCESTGQWTAVPLVCNPVNCGTPPTVANADVIAVTTVLGSVATTSCRAGYAITGTSKTQTCQADGTWSLPVPACHLADCGAPPALANGSVSAPKTTYNEIASYSCSPGFVLSGLAQRACQDNETWYGDAPTCQVFTPKLTINKAGSGLGTVTSSLSNVINCGTTCVATVTYNSDVTITATPDAGQSFIGWDSPACQGKAGCTIRMTKDTVVNAVFSPPPNIVFVTSTRSASNMGGLAGADAICAARATAGGLAGTYKAWLSTSTVNAKDRLGTASGWVRPDGKPVFSQLKDLESNKVFYPPNQDESGHVATGVQTVFTATEANGKSVEGSFSSTCADWTSDVDDGKYILVGSAGANSSQLTSYGGDKCGQGSALLCFGIDRTAFVAADPLPGGRAFVTEATWTPGGGIATADALCQKEATDAGLTGTFKALLSPTGASAASRFAGTDPWYRMDGLALAPTASAFFSNSSLDVAPNMTAKGAYSTGFHWGGGENPTAIGTDALNCKDWKSGLAADVSAMGYDSITFMGLFFGTYTARWQCSGSAHLVCLQAP